MLKGKAKCDFATPLRALAQQLGVSGCRIFHAPKFECCEEHYATIAAGDIGWAVFNPASRICKHQATALNKRFGCMVLELPEIVNTDPRAVEAGKAEGFGPRTSWDPASGASAAVRPLPENEDLQRRMADRERLLHLERYSYDFQFRPVNERLRWMVADGGQCPTGCP